MSISTSIADCCGDLDFTVDNFELSEDDRAGGGIGRGGHPMVLNDITSGDPPVRSYDPEKD